MGAPALLTRGVVDGETRFFLESLQLMSQSPKREKKAPLRDLRDLNQQMNTTCNINSLARSAINVFDPAACLDEDYEYQVATLTQLVTDLQRKDPALAMALGPQELCNLLETAFRDDRDITEVFNEFAAENAVNAVAA
jgi:hypothetical protein